MFCNPLSPCIYVPLEALIHGLGFETFSYMVTATLNTRCLWWKALYQCYRFKHSVCILHVGVLQNIVSKIFSKTIFLSFVKTHRIKEWTECKFQNKAMVIMN